MDLIEAARAILQDDSFVSMKEQEKKDLDQMRQDYLADKQRLVRSLNELHLKVNNLLSEAYEVQAESHRMTVHLDRFLKW